MEDRRGNFTPFVLAVDGLLQHEVSHFVKRLSASLASRWEKPFSDVLLLSTFDYSLLQCALPACVCEDLGSSGEVVLDMMMAHHFKLLINE